MSVNSVLCRPCLLLYLDVGQTLKFSLFRKKILDQLVPLFIGPSYLRHKGIPR